MRNYYNHLLRRWDGDFEKGKVDQTQDISLILTSQGKLRINGAMKHSGVSPKRYMIMSVSEREGLLLIRGDEWIEQFGGKELRKMAEKYNAA